MVSFSFVTAEFTMFISFPLCGSIYFTAPISPAGTESMVTAKLPSDIFSIPRTGHERGVPSIIMYPVAVSAPCGSPTIADAGFLRVLSLIFTCLDLISISMSSSREEFL